MKGRTRTQPYDCNQKCESSEYAYACVLYAASMCACAHRGKSLVQAHKRERAHTSKRTVNRNVICFRLRSCAIVQRRRGARSQQKIQGNEVCHSSPDAEYQSGNRSHRLVFPAKRNSLQFKFCLSVFGSHSTCNFRMSRLCVDMPHTQKDTLVKILVHALAGTDTFPLFLACPPWPSSSRCDALRMVCPFAVFLPLPLSLQVCVWEIDQQGENTWSLLPRY